MSAELSIADRRALVNKFLITLFPPNGIGIGVGRVDELAKPFGKKLSQIETQSAISAFITAVNGANTGSAIAQMKRDVNAAFE